MSLPEKKRCIALYKMERGVDTDVLGGAAGLTTVKHLHNIVLATRSKISKKSVVDMQREQRYIENIKL